MVLGENKTRILFDTELMLEYMGLINLLCDVSKPIYFGCQSVTNLESNNLQFGHRG